MALTGCPQLSAAWSWLTWLSLLLLAMRERGVASHPVGRLGLGLMSVFFVSLAMAETLMPRLLAATLGMERAVREIKELMA